MRLRGRVVGNKVVPYFSRAEITDKNSLAGKELVWVDSAVEAFFLQIQGSGRVYLEETQETIRVAYGDQNGHPYKSIGRFLVERGDLKLEQASAQGIAAWAAANPLRVQELLYGASNITNTERLFYRHAYRDEDVEAEIPTLKETMRDLFLDMKNYMKNNNLQSNVLQYVVLE